MKIDSTRISRILNLYASQDLQVRGVKNKGGKADEVILSKEAKVFQEALKAAKSDPGVCVAKVEEIRARIQSGQYRIDSRSVASKMVDDLLKQDR
ncbi:negative regulator of flagellin synthesis FlgM [Caldicoprobacter guelmensis]|uniref:flagellar biosynthesis anti-sigma factor FlgM n=1 Tax=Caldicoprobacter guelmensis TaxID=1170224 RepID=UPI001956BB66|nr:flagellar biosynthesis anti-sigma factor FlgM [Caldicoprobacter guelmensis]MBM7582622.1 negative regulator of flagellin synthesis FlgM [Caldicoprobacter guelmensis]